MQRLRVLFAVLLAMTLVSVAPADAADTHAPAQVPVVADSTRLDTPGVARVRPGTATFRVSTPEKESRWVVLARLHHRVTIAEFTATMTTVMRATDPIERERAVRTWHRQARVLGGVSVTHAAPQSFTQDLTPGAYYLIDLRSLMGPDPGEPVHPVTVTGTPRTGSPLANQVLVQHPTGYTTPPRLTTRTRLLVVNTTGRHEEAILMPVRPDTTKADAVAFIRGNQPNVSIGEPLGVTPLAGGHRVVAELTLPPGRYLLVLWVHDPLTMHQLLDVSERESPDRRNGS